MKYLSKVSVFILLVVIYVLVLSGCGIPGDNPDDDAKLKVALTILPQKEFIEAVCRDRAEVLTIVPLGSSPESYEPTAQQIEELAGADIYFKIGVPCEQAKSLTKPEKAVVINLAEKTADKYDDLMFAEGSRDPHIWLSPNRVVVMVNAIAKEISELDPENEEEYKLNAASYIAGLMQAKAYVNGLFKDIPEEDRVFLTFHPAFGYFADEFGLSMYSLEEEGKEATAKDLQNMIDFAKENNIKVLFTQAEDDSAQPKTFIAEVGGETVVLNPLSQDYIRNLKFMAEKIAGALT